MLWPFGHEPCPINSAHKWPTDQSTHTQNPKQKDYILMAVFYLECTAARLLHTSFCGFIQRSADIDECQDHIGRAFGRKKIRWPIRCLTLGARARAQICAHSSSNQVKRTVAMGSARTVSVAISWAVLGRDCAIAHLSLVAGALRSAQQTETRLDERQQKMCALARGTLCAAGEHCHFARDARRRMLGWGRNTNSIFLSNRARAHTTHRVQQLAVLCARYQSWQARLHSCSVSLFRFCRSHIKMVCG